ncbi:MAG: DNA/RNA nuclease SfsA [Rhodobacterales bacterium]|nr:MAG: DNA/RNA nuclease SfsA [Rhodobacterales bacterium]
MRFQRELIPATLIRRYKRFLADCRLSDGREVVAHVANPGAMTGLTEPGSRIWLEPNDDPKKKLDYGWRLLETPEGALVGVDTSQPNRMLKEALLAGKVPRLAGFPNLRAEVPYGTNSRVDFLLSGPEGPLHVEVKSVTTLRQPGLAEFPDCVTKRGAKHMAELADVVAQGGRAMVFFLAQRSDAQRVAVASDLDPGYGAAFRAAVDAGVEVLAHRAELSPQGIELGPELPFLDRRD